MNRHCPSSVGHILHRLFQTVSWQHQTEAPALYEIKQAKKKHHPGLVPAKALFGVRRLSTKLLTKALVISSVATGKWNTSRSKENTLKR